MFRYFQMMLAQTFFGRSENREPVSAEEIFFLFCITQSRPVESATFLIENLEHIALSTVGPIHVGGTITHIAYALSLLNQLSHLVPYYGYTLIYLDHCIDLGLVRRVFFSTEHYKLLINNEVVHHFSLPHHKRTSIHNRENLTYALEAQGDTPTKPATPPTPEYHPTPPRI